jgi:hypothetical protein
MMKRAYKDPAAAVEEYGSREYGEETLADPLFHCTPTLTLFEAHTEDEKKTVASMRPLTAHGMLDAPGGLSPELDGLLNGIKEGGAADEDIEGFHEDINVIICPHRTVDPPTEHRSVDHIMGIWTMMGPDLIRGFLHVINSKWE